MSDDEYEIPLQDQRVFGSGIKRQRVKFVPSSSASPDVRLPPTKTKSASESYLSLVLPNEQREEHGSSTDATLQGVPSNDSRPVLDTEICEVCQLPLSSNEPDIVNLAEDSPNTKVATGFTKARPHEASLSHQVCLAHSHPPSHLDRNRKGLAYLSSYGWDPDSRRGLGAEDQGIRFPINTKPKDDKLGLGVVLPKPGAIPKKVKVAKLDAGKVRKMYEKDKKKAEKLRDVFYRNDDVERYLGG
ncbi:hypothetical protein BJ878DRAFT_190455 [Calycina marina]|uniref:G-patch domain-containing protein n=1 Tax=Calycina marina TaxID=1763456 RepID=A0A9P7Z8R8_9HELO|nr:hypothetical protein BJ878DRAFT_190455 [Calycina marina]